MSKNLVIVESPTKAKTISRFLGKDYKVVASMGHVQDLPKSTMGIDIEHDFKAKFIVPPDKKKLVADLKKEAKSSETLWIATDEDREGEAIGWHLTQVLEPKIPVHRIVFHEITKSAISNAIKHPREIDRDIVNAQHARRILDRLVGYELSPLLWKKVHYGLSAGRVQSVAVRLVVEREREIKKFKPEEYWEIKGLFKKDSDTFEASLEKFNNKKIEIKNEKESSLILKELEKAEYKISEVEEKQLRKSPPPPFTTSTLQQEASRKLGFGVRKTMFIAQQLYEGINLGKGEVGLISYMRTDSVHLSETATSDAKKVIEEKYGKSYALSSPRQYKSKKSAQEAHEAIRPVNIALFPEDVKNTLSKDQFKLYKIIWERTVACQMAEAIINKTEAFIDSFKANKKTGYLFKAVGQVIEFPGFMEVYIEGHDAGEEENGEGILPMLKSGDHVKEEKIESSQHFTNPPPRYTEASLVKKLESEGIGRPSTYAPTIHTIITRGYVVKEGKTLKPTDTADVVTDLLVENFPHVIDYKFTADMEEKLDKIEEEKLKWIPMLKEFYEPFHKNLKEKEKTLNKSDIVNEKSDEKCEKCGSPMVIKLGRFGKFLSCSNYPKCKNAKPLEGHGKEIPPQESKEVEEFKKKFHDKKCDKCGKPMIVRAGKYGPFLGCSGYPKCKNIVALTVFSGVKCPECKMGQMVERRTRKGARVFWGCNKFPKCKFATWDKPIGMCKKCGHLEVENKEGKVHCPECDKTGKQKK